MARRFVLFQRWSSVASSVRYNKTLTSTRRARAFRRGKGWRARARATPARARSWREFIWRWM